MRLYTIPYAGGFAFTYLKWRKYLDKKIKLCSIELPGRGTRIEETACNSIEEMAEDVLQHIETEEEEYALFGHSMGAYVLLELYAKIHNRNKTLPKNIFISAMKPPHMYKSEGYHMLNNEKFRDKMCSMGGIPRQINEDIEFSDHFYGLYHIAQALNRALGGGQSEYKDSIRKALKEHNRDDFTLWVDTYESTLEEPKKVEKVNAFRT